MCRSLLVPIVGLPYVRRLRPDPDLCAELAAQVGTEMFFAFTQETMSVDCAAHARHVWFGAVTSGEDPASGSGCAALASYLVEEEVLLAAPTADVLIEQGAPDRPGQVEVLVEVNNRQISRVRVGGRALHIGDGELRLP